MLESYPWRGPLSLDFKPFAIQLQGTVPRLLLPLCSSAFLASLISRVPLHRGLSVSHRQREEPPPSLDDLAPSPVLHLLLPGQRPAHPHPPSLQQGLHGPGRVPAVRQGPLPPGVGQTGEPAPAAGAPAPLSAAGQEASPLQGALSARDPGGLPLPLPPARPPWPPGASPAPSSL